MNLMSVLEAVTVYREGALCVRVARTPAGEAVVNHHVRVVGLPLSLMPGSLRARIAGAAEVRVLDVRAAFEVVLGENIDTPAEQMRVRAEEKNAGELSDELTLLRQEISGLEKLRPRRLDPAQGEAPRAAAVDAALALADFAEGRLVACFSRRRALEKKLTLAQERLALAQHRLAEASVDARSSRAKITRVAAITLSGPIPAGPGAEISVEYVVPGARWLPNYQLRLAKGFAGGSLMLRASVAQSSGEDWSGVTLSLSTASLSRRADAPELKSLRIGRSQPAPHASGWREPPQGLDALFEAFDANAMAGAGAAEPKVRDEDGGPGAALTPPAGALMASRSMMMAGMPKSASAPARGRVMAKKGMLPGSPPLGASFASSEMLRVAPSADVGSFDEEMAGAPAGEAAAESHADENNLGEGFLDYDSLMMRDASGGPGVRGRLAPAETPALVMAMGLSVRIDVVMVAVSAARDLALQVSWLPPPGGCFPVQSLNHFDYRYDCHGRLDVPSLGRWVTVPVMACEVKLAPQYVTVPSLEPKVYRTLAIDNATPFALLAGPVDVSAGDEFLLTTSLPAMPPGDNSARLGLGVEEAIKVARKTSYTETSGGFLGGSAVMPHEVSVEINNRLSTPAVIEVQERVPWADPSEKDVKVEENAVTPAWERIERPVEGVVTNGARRWVVTVPGGQSTTLRAQYTIRIPADRMLAGGNRRS